MLMRACALCEQPAPNRADGPLLPCPIWDTRTRLCPVLAHFLILVLILILIVLVLVLVFLFLLPAVLLSFDAEPAVDGRAQM